jgi:hypothetical protein
MNNPEGLVTTRGDHDGTPLDGDVGCLNAARVGIPGVIVIT